VDASVGPDAAPFAKKALAEQTLKFLKTKNVTVGGAFVGASDAELEKLMSQAITDDHLDHLMTKTVQDDAMINVVRILQKRPDLADRVNRRASAGHPAATEIHTGLALAAAARSGDPSAKKAYVEWCSTPPHSSSGHMRLPVGYNGNPNHLKPGTRFKNKYGHNMVIDRYGFAHLAGEDSLGDFVGTFVGKSDDFKQLIIAALKSKRMSKDDFNKAVTAHVKPGASQAEKTAAGEKMLGFLKAKNVVIGGWVPDPEDEIANRISKALKTKKMSRNDFNGIVALRAGNDATQEAKERSAKELLKQLSDKGIKIG
jgi:hypothetical protein